MNRLRAIMILNAVALALASSAHAMTGRFASLDFVVLTSERIALVEIESVTNGEPMPQASVPDRTISHHLVRELLGKGPARGEFTQRVFTLGEPPPPSPGDTLLVLWRLSGQAKPHDIYWFNLSRPGSSPDPALTNDFRVVHEPDSILALVERRIGMIAAGRPLGDDRPWSLPDFLQGRGSLVDWMPPESEAQEATHRGSINLLQVPADIDRLPLLLEETRSESVLVRVAAASSLGQYPVPSAIARLTEMLADTSTYVLEMVKDSSQLRVAVHAPRAQAYQTLRALGVSAPRPEGFETDSLYLMYFGR